MFQILTAVTFTAIQLSSVAAAPSHLLPEGFPPLSLKGRKGDLDLGSLSINPVALASAVDLKKVAAKVVELEKELDALKTGKADKTDVTNLASKTELAGKADSSALTTKADKAELANLATKTELASKAETSAVAQKADASALAGKADHSALATKADKADLDTKADKSELEELRKSLPKKVKMVEIGYSTTYTPHGSGVCYESVSSNRHNHGLYLGRIKTIPGSSFTTVQESLQKCDDECRNDDLCIAYQVNKKNRECVVIGGTQTIADVKVEMDAADGTPSPNPLYHFWNPGTGVNIHPHTVNRAHCVVKTEYLGRNRANYLKLPDFKENGWVRGTAAN